MDETMDRVDAAILRRLTLHKCWLRLPELCQTDEYDLTEAELLDRLERLVGRGFLRHSHHFHISDSGAEQVPRLHCHRSLV